MTKLINYFIVIDPFSTDCSRRNDNGNHIETLPEVYPELKEFLEFANFEEMTESLGVGDIVWSIASGMGQPDGIRRLIITDVNLGRIWAEPCPEGEKAYWRDDDVIVSANSHMYLGSLFTTKEKANGFYQQLRKRYEQDSKWNQAVSRRWAIHDSDII